MSQAETKTRVGRPTVGTTKTMSLTLRDEDWERLRVLLEYEGRNRSEFLRELISRELDARGIVVADT